MFIEFDEYTLIDFFENEPVFVGEYDAGNLIFMIEKNKFKLLMLISTYEKYINLSVTYDNNIVCEQTFNGIKKISENDNCLIIYKSDGRIIIKKEKQLGYIVE